MGWGCSLLTDSGRFQMVGLLDLAEITEDGGTPITIRYNLQIQMYRIMIGIPPSSVISARSSRLTIWNPPLSVSRPRSQPMNACRPPAFCRVSIPGLNGMFDIRFINYLLQAWVGSAAS